MSSPPTSPVVRPVGPVWLVLVSPVPEAPARCSVVVTNVGDVAAQRVVLRRFTEDEPGPVLAGAESLQPEAEMHLELDRPDAGEGVLVLQWIHDGQPHHRQVHLDTPV